MLSKPRRSSFSLRRIISTIWTWLGWGRGRGGDWVLEGRAGDWPKERRAGDWPEEGGAGDCMNIAWAVTQNSPHIETGHQGR